MHICDLDEDTAALILQNLAPSELGRLSCVSRWFRRLCQHSALWEQFARARWTTLTPHLVPDEGHETNGRSWRGLYSSLNGWRAPAFRFADKLSVDGHSISALHAFSPTALGWQTSAAPAHGDTWLALGTLEGIEINTIDPVQEGASNAVLAKYTGPGEPLAVAALPNNALVSGFNNDGSLSFLKLEGAIIRHHVIWAALMHCGEMPLRKVTVISLKWKRLCRPPCVDLQVCLDSQRLYSLHDGTSWQHAGQRSLLQQIDLATQTTIMTAHEFSEQFELVCCAPGRQGGDWGNELYAGAVHGSFCTRCQQEGMPSLCHHKAKSATAALCVFDLRAQMCMVQRYGTHHRSLYPHMSNAGARGTYLFTSHVGTPLCCWDKRNMSIPVHESQQLGCFSHFYPPMPLPPPRAAAEHSAMWLETETGGDLLLGRADNGMMWRWDLTATLGWQAASNLWHGQGSWLTHSAEGPWEDGGKYFQDWPQPMGAWSVDAALPEFRIDVGAKYQLIGLEAGVCEGYEGVDYVACAALDGQLTAE